MDKEVFYVVLFEKQARGFQNHQNRGTYVGTFEVKLLIN